MVPSSASGRVFISYARRDAAELAQKLYKDLKQLGYDAWLDTSRLRGGAIWSREIERALDDCDVLIALLSSGSYESDICRAEQLRSLRHGKCVIPVLIQAEAEIPLHLEARQCVDLSRPSDRDSLRKLLDQMDAGTGASVRQENRQTYVTAPPLPVHFVERPDELDALRNAVIGEDTSRHIALTALRGMGGLGKTILAQALCHDEVIQDAFPDGVIWVTLGETPGDLVVPMREIAKALGEPLERYDSLPACSNQLRNALRDKAVLLVLDDAWDARHVEPFRADARRSRLLITTRDATIASALGAQEHSLDVLSREQSLELLARWSQRAPGHGFPPEAVEVAYECGHLPLALAMIGAQMRGRPDDRWASVLRTLRSADLERIARQFPNYAHPNLLRAVQVSIDQLDSETREHYLDLAVYPEDTPIPGGALEVHWDLSPDGVRDVTDRLSDLSLAGYDQQSWLTIHDVQLMYARRMREAELTNLHGRLLERYAIRCADGWPSGPHDEYFHQHLAYHLLHANRRDELRNLLFDYRWLEAKLEACGPYALVQDYFHMPEHQDARLVQGAIRLSMPALESDRNHLPSQLTGRLLRFDSVSIKEMLEQIREVVERPWLRPLTACLHEPGGPLLMTLEGHTSDINAVAVSVDGCRTASGSADNTVRVWDTDSGALLRTLKGHTDGVTSVAVSADGRRAVSGSGDKTVRVWDTDSGALLHTLEAHTAPIWAVAISADGRRAVSGSRDKTVRVWHTDAGTLLHSLEGHTEEVVAVVVSADGRRAVSGSFDKTVRVWDTDSGALLRTLEGHTDWVEAVAISADGRRAVSGSEDNTVRVWDTEAGRASGSFRADAEAPCCAGSADGATIVSGDRLGRMHFLRLENIKSR